MAETKCAGWRRDCVPVWLREKGFEAPGWAAADRAGALGIVLDEGGADEGRDDTAPLPAGKGEHVTHEVVTGISCEDGGAASGCGSWRKRLRQINTWFACTSY